MALSHLMKFYYLLKPFILRRVLIYVRSCIVLRKRQTCSAIWPILHAAASPPATWSGWPDGKQFALVLTHDVEAAAGITKCREVMKLEQYLGFRSSFNFVPGDYPVDHELRSLLKDNGFEVGVHGWTHDGSLYNTRDIFLQQARKINNCLKEWNVVGFRSPAMHHNLDWLRDLDIEYDLSTFDTDPFEPQTDGMGTIFPFPVVEDFCRKGYIEMPYTLPQDSTLFIIMREKTIDIWKHKLDWVAEHGGMALVNTHPDYMNFAKASPGFAEYSAEYYSELLDYIKTHYGDGYWHPLPREMARFWADNYGDQTRNMTLSGNCIEANTPESLKSSAADVQGDFY
jgi:peptidoglycan/xylan/chitin deacetylase (PgdA/CDA1 family)